MSNWRVLLLLLLLLVAALSSVSGVTKPSQFTRFRPISQAEYEAILSLTDGKQVVSEGRLINGGLAALAGLTSGWVTSLRFPNIFGSFGEAQKAPNTSYPLCVIRTEEAIDSVEQHHHQQEHHEHHENYHHALGRSVDVESHESHDGFDSHESAEHEYHHLVQQQQQHEEDHSNEFEGSVEHDTGSSIGSVWDGSKLAPVVNCIVVLKEDKHHYEEEHTKTTKRPKHHRKKHRTYYSHSHLPPPPTYEAPPPPPSSYPAPPSYPPPPSASGLYPYPPPSRLYSAPPSPPSSGSYINNPWHWQTPYYSSYYSDPRSNAGIYPTAYTDIYAGTNPSAYTGAYPSTYPNVIVAPAIRNNPNTYYHTTSNPYLDITPSAYPSVAYNTQPSGDTSNYSDVESPIIRKITTMNLNSAKTKPHNPQDVKVRNDISLKTKKPVASKLPSVNQKQKSKHPAKAHPQMEHNSDTQYPTTIVPISRRHTKVKRDEQGTLSNSYAKITSYSESGYQPTLYPQNSYQSDYPKVSYTHALPYPAPVYVRNSIEQPNVQSNTKPHVQAYEADSEENDDSPEFITVRKNN